MTNPSKPNKQDKWEKKDEILEVSSTKIVFTRRVSRSGGNRQHIFTCPLSLTSFLPFGKRFKVTIEPYE